MSSHPNPSEVVGDPQKFNPKQSDLLMEFPTPIAPVIRIFKDGRVERLVKVDWTPPTTTDDGHTTVLSKDIVISSETGVSARLFLPRQAVLALGELDESCKSTSTSNNKLPLVLYTHGGGFCIESAFSSIFDGYVSSLVAEANVVALSVDYRLVPENPITLCYEDAWDAIQWAVSHCSGDGPEPWLNHHVDFNRVFFAGDSAGANIAYNMAWRVGRDRQGCRLRPIQDQDCGGGDHVATLEGIALIHPFFGLDDRPNQLWEMYCPDSKGAADPRINPALHPEVMAALGCRRVLVCLAGKEISWMKEEKQLGINYYEKLKSSGWEGEAEIFETPGETHDFHLFDPHKETARDLLKKVASFLNQKI